MLKDDTFIYGNNYILSTHFFPSLVSPIEYNACFPANTVGIANIPPYSSTWPNFRSTQYQKSKSSNAARRVVKGRIVGENRRGVLGPTLIHCACSISLIPVKIGMQHTNARRRTQGESTRPENTAEMKRGGSFCSGRKVWWRVGRTWKDASSGCTGGGCDAGTTRSKSSMVAGSCTNEPKSRDTFRGALVVGGKDAGGRAIFCSTFRTR